ncbi:diacylglycerol kinase [Sulfurospirillum sp. hDNRA2]|uniref:diacylglycerol kinase n=1 Tax=Sulfurospirillum sp. hDNRA2 TaxID=3237298 RepID=UPI0020B76632|nr:diacylglycerol kinase [Sulfurospirillum sp. DNRA8]MCD8545209.1 diacylglycerol kinase [Sulfurospirillum cavolei]MCP3650823.1 diacylglycerol kinase [Sulfurospirillum sp. DNRA8]MCR1809668.1 diacylglycerol kinase [Sulfurospirillum sp. DNRA8]
MKNKFLNTGEYGYHPLRKFKIILSGLRYAVIYDFSVMYKIIISILIFIPVVIFKEWLDASLIILATGVMLAAEMFNSAIEAICDFMETRHNEKIKIIKDIAASATGVTIFVWIVVICIEAIEVGKIF